MKLTLEKNDQGYPQPYNPGYYQLAPQSFYVDRFDSLACRPVLIAVAAPASRAATPAPAQRAAG